MLTSRAVLSLLGVLLSAGLDPSRGDCSNTSTGNIPLNDLGTGTYQGVEGGLYPGGVNVRPLSHDRDLERTGGRLMLLDAAGNPDPVNGIFVLISIGNSNATQEFTRFKTHAGEDPDLNSRVVLVDCAKFQQGADVISNPNAAYWTLVDDRLAEAGVTPLQVQAVWLKEALPFPTESWPDSAIVFQDDLRAIAQILKSRYTNTKSIYHTSRIYGGYGQDGASPEPYPYHYGFSVKWLLEEQLSGSLELNFDPARGPVEAPWMSWGPYLWADGLVPRSDGLIWECLDFMEDGTHTSSQGRDKVAFRMLDFFKTDPTTKPWFFDCNLGDPDTFASPPEVLGDRLTKVPGGIEIAWESLDPVIGIGAVYDVVVGSISELRADSGFARASCVAAGLTDTPYVDTGSDPPPGDGSYFLARGRSSCGTGTFGDGSVIPDPRDALDAGTPACP
jgi:hypothetical protein